MRITIAIRVNGAIGINGTIDIVIAGVSSPIANLVVVARSNNVIAIGIVAIGVSIAGPGGFNSGFSGDNLRPERR
jgi:hypothetical protein